MVSRGSTVSIEAVVERKDRALPRFVVLPADELAGWALEGTTVVDAKINDCTVGRRSLKRLGRDIDAWFIDLPSRVCDRLGIETGQRVIVTLSLAAEELPPELSALIQANPIARRKWEGLTSSQKRALREHVLAAKRVETRTRRAERSLLGNG